MGTGIVGREIFSTPGVEILGEVHRATAGVGLGDESDQERDVRVVLV